MNLCVSHIISISIANILKKIEIHKLEARTNSHLVIGLQNLLIISHETSFKNHKIKNRTCTEPYTVYAMVARYSITKSRYLKNNLALDVLSGI